MFLNPLISAGNVGRGEQRTAQHEPQEMKLSGGFTVTSGDDVYKKIYTGLFFHFVFTIS